MFGGGYLQKIERCFTIPPLSRVMREVVACECGGGSGVLSGSKDSLGAESRTTAHHGRLFCGLKRSLHVFLCGGVQGGVGGEVLCDPLVVFVMHKSADSK